MICWKCYKEVCLLQLKSFKIIRAFRLSCALHILTSCCPQLCQYLPNISISTHARFFAGQIKNASWVLVYVFVRSVTYFNCNALFFLPPRTYSFHLDNSSKTGEHFFEWNEKRETEIYESTYFLVKRETEYIIATFTTVKGVSSMFEAKVYDHVDLLFYF